MEDEKLRGSWGLTRLLDFSFTKRGGEFQDPPPKDEPGKLHNFFSWWSAKKIDGSLNFVVRTSKGKNFAFKVSNTEDLKNEIRQAIWSDLQQEHVDDPGLDTIFQELKRLTPPDGEPIVDENAHYMEVEQVQSLLIAHVVEELEIHSTPPYDMKFDKWPEFLGTMTNLKTLDLAQHALTSIDPNIQNLSKLEKLNLSDNKIKMLPDEIAKIESLTSINLSHNALTYLPNLGQLQNLIHLNLSHNILTSLPDTFNVLINLKEANFSHNRLSFLPCLNNLLNLEKLDLSHNSYKIPLMSSKGYLSELANLENLKILNFNHNGFNIIPDSIGKLTCLEELDIEHNQLSSFSLSEEDIPNFKQLRKINVSHNKITKISIGLSNLTALTEFILNDNQLSDLPFSLSPFTTLNLLDLNNNQFRTIPIGIFSSKSLKTLLLSNNFIEYIPAEIADLVNLDHLDLSHNKLKQIVHELTHLNRLTHVDLSDNNFSTLPTTIGSLKNIKSLLLNENPLLTILPRSLSQMDGLKKISIANVRVEINSNKSIEAEIIESETNQVQQLITLARTSDHPLIAYGLCCISRAASQQEEFINCGGIEELFDMVQNRDMSLQLEAMSVIEELCKGKNYAVKLYQHRGHDLLFDIAVNSKNVDMQAVAVRSLSHLSMNEALRTIIGGMKSELNSVKKFLLHSSSTLKECTKLFLASVGIDTKFDNTSKRGVRVLTLDGGGIRGLVSVLILKKIEELTQKPICELFDLVVGTSTGAMLAVLIGIKKSSMDEVKELYLTFCEKTFLSHAEIIQLKNDPPPSPSSTPYPEQVSPTPSQSSALDNSVNYPSTLSPRKMPPSGLPTQAWWSLINYSNFIQKGSWYGTSIFEKLIIDYIGNGSLIASATHTDTKVCLVSSLISVAPVSAYLFRNYKTPLGSVARYKGDCDAAIWQAVRASTSVPGYFDPLEKDGFVYRDGGMVANNPSGIAISEARTLWKDRNIDLFFSCGTGRSNSVPITNPNSYSNLLTQLVNSVTETEITHHTLLDTMAPGTYYRIQPVDDTFNIDLCETSPTKLEAMITFTTNWIEQNNKLFETICEKLLAE